MVLFRLCVLFFFCFVFYFCPIDLSLNNNNKKTDLIVLSFNNILPAVVILRQDDDLQILGKSCNFNAVSQPIIINIRIGNSPR